MRRLAFGFVLFVAASLAALAPFAGFDGGGRGADLTACFGYEPESLDPLQVTGILESRYLEALFEGLMRLDPRTQDPIPGMAERVEVSPDKRTYTFHLRDARWTDGAPVTAEDFAWSWRRLLHPQSKCEYVYMLYPIRNAQGYNQQGAADLALGDGALASADIDRRRQALEILGEGAARRHVPTLEEALARESDAELRAALRRVLERARGTDDVTGIGQVGLEVLDPKTIRVTLDHPTPYFLSLTAFMTLLPVNRRCVESHGDHWIKPGRIVTNGPYRLEEWRPYARLVLVKNPDYWDASNVRVRRIVCLSVVDETARLNFYETGVCDWFIDPPIQFIDALKAHPDFRAEPAFRTQYLMFNVTRHPALRDVRVRKALGQAIDRAAITERVTKAGEIPRGGFVPHGLPGYESPPGLAYDPAAARRLLIEAGYPGGRGFPPDIRLLTSTSPDAKRLAEVIQQMWKQTLGFEIPLQSVERKMWFEAMRTLDYDITLMGWIGDYRDPMTFMDMYVTGGGNNRAGWSNARYDAFIRRAALEPDEAKRNALFREAESILIVEEAPIVPLYQAVSLSMRRPWVKGVYPNIQGVYPLRGVWSER